MPRRRYLYHKENDRQGRYVVGKEAGCVCVAGRWEGGRETDRQTDRRAGAKKKRYQMME